MSKECPICRKSVEDTAIVCPHCGATLSTEIGWKSSAFWMDPVPMDNKGYPSSAARGLSIALAVLCFISAASMLLLLLLAAAIGGMMEEMGLLEEYAEVLAALSLYFWPFMLLFIADAAFYTVFGILLLVKKSWKIALTITVYSSVWVVLEIIGGSFGGIPVLPVLGILSTIWLRKPPETPGNRVL